MKKSFVLSTVTAAVALLAGASAAKATSAEFSVPQVQPSLVTPADTFSFDILAYNSTSGNGYFIAKGSRRSERPRPTLTWTGISSP